MNGKEIFIDTNIAIYLLKGDNTIAELLRGKKIYVSFITELELIGYPNLTKEEGERIQSFLNACYIIALTVEIKAAYVGIRRVNKTKLADAIVAASAKTSNLPLLTADQGFSRISELDVLLYQYQP